MSKFPVEVVYRSGELNIASDILARQTWFRIEPILCAEISWTTELNSIFML